MSVRSHGEVVADLRDEDTHVDIVFKQWTTLVQPCQQQEVLDEGLHAICLCLDAPQRHLTIVLADVPPVQPAYP